MFCNCPKCCNEIYSFDQCDFNCLRDQWSNCACTCEQTTQKCCCCRRPQPKPICKGRFGLAWIVETPTQTCCKPTGWQLEFEGTPSMLDCKCEQLIRWANCPPGGRAQDEVSGGNNCCCMATLHDALINEGFDDCKDRSGVKDCGCDCDIWSSKNGPNGARGGNRRGRGSKFNHYDGSELLKKIRNAHETREHVAHDEHEPGTVPHEKKEPETAANGVKVISPVSQSE